MPIRLRESGKTTAVADLKRVLTAASEERPPVILDPAPPEDPPVLLWQAPGGSCIIF